MDKSKDGLDTLLNEHRSKMWDADVRKAVRDQQRTMNMLRVLGITGGELPGEYMVRVKDIRIVLIDNGTQWAWIALPIDYTGNGRCIGRVNGPRSEWWYKRGFGRRALAAALIEAVDSVAKYNWGNDPGKRPPFPAPYGYES